MHALSWPIFQPIASSCHKLELILPVDWQPDPKLTLLPYTVLPALSCMPICLFPNDASFWQAKHAFM